MSLGRRRAYGGVATFPALVFMPKEGQSPSAGRQRRAGQSLAQISHQLFEARQVAALLLGPPVVSASAVAFSLFGGAEL